MESAIRRLKARHQNKTCSTKPLGEIAQEITEVILDGSIIRSIQISDGSLLLEFPNMTTLSMNQVHVNSIANLPPLPLLKHFECTDNKLTDAVLADIAIKFPLLECLEIGGNNIQELYSLKQLAQLPHLRVLGINLNPAVNSPEYSRETVFEMIISLEVLDGQDRNGACVEEDMSDEEGDTTLKAFYAKDYDSTEAMDDQGDFVPVAEEESEEFTDHDDDSGS